jgi:hypothetical protein
MRHRSRRRRAVPVPFAGPEPNNVTGPDLFDRSALALHASATRGDDQRLPKRMRVPGGAGARFERDDRAADARRCVPLKPRIDPEEPVNQSAGPLADGCDPVLVISTVLPPARRSTARLRRRVGGSHPACGVEPDRYEPSSVASLPPDQLLEVLGIPRTMDLDPRCGALHLTQVVGGELNLRRTEVLVETTAFGGSGNRHDPGLLR